MLGVLNINGRIWCCFLLLITSYSAELQIRTLEKHGGNIPNLSRAENPENRMGQYSKSFDEGWESRKLFCPVQLMLGLWSNWLLKFREKRKVRQALGKGDKERSDKLFHFIFLMLPQASAPFVYTMFICGKTYHRESAIYCTSPCNCSFSGEEDSLIIIAANVCCQGAAMFSYSLASGNYSGAYLLFRTMISVRPCISKTLTSLFIICYWFTLVSKAQAQCSSFIGSHTGKMLNLALLLNVVFFSSLLSALERWKSWKRMAKYRAKDLPPF